MNSQNNRRVFLKTAAFAGLGTLVLCDSRPAFSYEANEKLNIALIGVGGRGRWFVGTIPKLGTNVVAMCDVNDRKAELSFKEIPQARKFHDFRKMLDEMGKDIDAVVIAIPDNTHAVAAAAAAIQAGKSVFCEKPLTHDIKEARILRELAAKYKVATQMGNQGTSSEAFRRAVELIQAGVIGEVRQVHAWNTGGGPGDRPIPTDEHPIPEYLKWDLWLGPAQYRPYNSRWLAGWHGWRDFGTGNLGNWASHTMNLPFKALRLDTLWDRQSGVLADRVVKLTPEVSGVHKHTYPKWEIIHYDFPVRGDMPPVRINWYNGPGQAPGSRAMIEQMIGRRLDWGDAGEKKWKDHAGCLPHRQQRDDSLDGTQYVLFAAAGREVQGFRRSAANAAPRQRPRAGMACRLQGWAGPDVQLRVCGSLGGIHAAGQRCDTRRRDHRVRSARDESSQQSKGNRRP